MWKLTIEDDQGNRIPVPLVRDDYSIGRAVENTLRLTERNVSRSHATLRHEDGRWYLHDLGSYNGCYVNGQRVPEQQELSHGDLIQLGDYRIEIFEEADAPAVVAAPPFKEVEAETAPWVATPSPEPTLSGTEVPEAPAEPVAEAPRAPASFFQDSLDELDAIPGVPKRRSPLATFAVLGVAALALGGAGFALLRPEPSAKTEAVNVVPEARAELAKVAEPEVAEAEIEVAQAAEPEIEVAQAAEPGPVEEEAEAALTQASEPVAVPSPPEPKQAALARAPAPRAEEKPRAAAAPAPAKGQAGGDRRPVLAANPFDSPSGREPAKAPAKTTSGKPAGGSSLTELAAQGSEGEAKMRPILEQRIARGTASANDIKLLRAICRNMGDRVCADRMTALLAEKK